MNGKHHSGEHESAEPYGKHHAARVGGLSVASLLERVARAGQAVRLAWRGAERQGLAATEDDFPTAVLPVIRDQVADVASDDEETEPTTATQEARRWLRPPGFSWWQQCLARI
jgi:hypothetical protein